MNEQASNTNAVFMEITSRKVEGQDKRIAAVEEKIKNIPDNTELIQKLLGTVEGLRVEVKNSRFPGEKMKDFSAQLDLAISLLDRPVQNKVLHHHYVPKIIWITFGLFVALALACSGWYMTVIKLDGYIANDTKYRHLRLDTSFKKLQIYLDLTDSLYNTRPDMRKVVLETEEEYRQNFERLQKAERLKAEAKDLEKAVKQR